MNTLLVSAADIKAATTVELAVDGHKLTVAVPLAQGKHLRPLLGLPLFEALLDYAATAPVAPIAPATGAAPAVKETYNTALATYRDQLAAWRTARENEPLLILWDQTKPMLCAWALVEAWPSLLGHITEAGFVTKVGAQTTGTSSADVLLVDRTLNYHTQNAAYHQDEFTRWLNQNAANYAEQRPTPQPVITTPTSVAGGIFLNYD